MKTTIELPDELVQKAKIVAVARSTTLRQLVQLGLERVLEEEQVSAKSRAKKLFAAMDRLPEFSASKRLSRSETHAR